MHIDRQALHNELHARPSVYFDAPACVFHLAFLAPDHQLEQVLYELQAHLGDTVRAPAPYGEAQLEGCRLKWERHSEFLTLTAVLATPDCDTPWLELPGFLETLCARHQKALINYSQIRVIEDGTTPLAAFGFRDPCGSQIGSGDAVAWSDFRLASDGANRVLLVNRRLNAYRLGRMVRRLSEMETYRMMAQVTLPLARQVAQELSGFERELDELSERTAQLGQGDAQHLLHDIARLSTRVTHCKTRNASRFAATGAYAELVFERIRELREEHAGDCQRLGVFIERRFRPSVRFCASTRERLDQLAQSVSHLGGLLQARAQVELEAQNSQILQSLNARTQTQIKIQKAVEGLSSIAIAYYFISLLKLLYQGTETLGASITPVQAIAVGAPLTLAVLYAVKLKVKRAVG